MRAHKASATARTIAAACLLHHAQFAHDARVSPEMDALCFQFLQSCAIDRMLAASAKFAATQTLWRGIEGITLPGIVSHYLNRKVRIESTLRELLAKNVVSDVIILGAGLDTLTARLAPQFPSVAFVEVDHPATQRVKREGLARAGNIPKNLTLHACDLQTSLPSVLTEKRSVSRVVIAEGLLMYFEAARVEQILRASLGAGECNAHVIFTYMEKRNDGAIGFEPHSAVIGWWLRMKGEPFKWAIEFETVATLANLLNAQLIVNVRAEDFSKPSPPGLSQLRGENFAVLRRFA
jgi:O-methyltransferase involved in polyketide biosynthesis